MTSLLLCLTLALSAPLAMAAHEGHGDGEKGDKGESGGKGGMGGMGGMGGHGMHMQNTPGTVMQKCKEMGHMLPHYCEPSYKAVSSAKGVQISDVSPAGDNAIMITLAELNVMNPGVTQDLVVVGGSGDLAGAAIVKGGWKKSTMVHLEFVGIGSIYSAGMMPVHVFPLTGH